MAEERQPPAGRESGEESREGGSRRRYFRRRQRPGQPAREGDGPREGNSQREGGGPRDRNAPRDGGGGRDRNGPREGGAPRDGNPARASNGPREPDSRGPRRRGGADRRAPDHTESRNPRLGRRRRRSRSRDTMAPNQRSEMILQEVVDLDDYRAPSSVFVYTHVSRPGSAWDSFEFRAEHFSKGGRTLDDFEIDLSKLYPDGAQESLTPNESMSDE